MNDGFQNSGPFGMADENLNLWLYLFEAEYIIYSRTNLIESHISVINKMHNFFAWFSSRFVYVNLRAVFFVFRYLQEREGRVHGNWK